MTVRFKKRTHPVAASRSRCKSLNAQVPRKRLSEECVKYLAEPLH